MQIRLLSVSTGTVRVLAAMLSVSGLLAACGGGGGGDGGSTPTPTPTPTPTFTIGGTVAGLATGASVVLQNSGANATTVTANGSFTFSTAVSSGGAYAVTVSTQPSTPPQVCSVTNGSGTASANVTNVTVTCATSSYTVSGTIAGLTGSGLVLQNNGGNNQTPAAAATTFAFPAIAGGTAYAVTVLTQPTSPAQTCTVANGTGTGNSGNITNVAVTCVTNTIPTFAVNVAVTGLTGSGLVLRNNGGNNLAVAANGSFAFSTLLASGAAYNVTVFTQPSTPSQTCTVTNPTGTMGSAAVTLAVSCVTTPYTIGGTVTVTGGGTLGTGLQLKNNGGAALAVPASGSFVFPGTVAPGATYAVTVSALPASPSQTCSVANGSGTVASANITNVIVTCTTSTFTVGGTISGLPTSNSVVLQNNASAATNLTVAANGTFTFTAPVASGGAYAVTVLTQPVQPVDAFNHSTAPARICDVKTGSGTVGAANVTTVVVLCHARYAFVANRSGDAGLASYSIGATGLLSLADFQSQTGEILNSAPATAPAGADADGVAVTSSGSHAFVTVSPQLSTAPSYANFIGRVKVYEIGTAGPGKLTYATSIDLPNVTPTPNVHGNPSRILMHPKKNFVYVQDQNSNNVNGTIVTGGNNVIRGYTFAPDTSILTPTTGAGYVAVPSLQSMEIDPAGTYMVASEFTAHKVDKFPIDGTTGALGAAAASVVVGTQASPLHMALDPTGSYMFVAHEMDFTIGAYNASTFAQVGVSQLVYRGIESPMPVVGLLVDPIRPVLYAARYDGSIDVYAITPLNGAITYVQTYRRAVAPFGVLYTLSIDPDGLFLYHVSQSTTGDFGIFSIGANGALTEVLPGSPYIPGNLPGAPTGTRNFAIP
jgi:6-phosphogluconolactonase (cycloisomerase 2 family)